MNHFLSSLVSRDLRASLLWLDYSPYFLGGCEMPRSYFFTYFLENYNVPEIEKYNLN